MKKLMTAVSIIASTLGYADLVPIQNQQHQQQQQRQCQPSKVWMIVSTEYGGDSPLGGLRNFDARYHKMFEDLGYETQEIHRAQLHTQANPCDLVLEVEMTYLKLFNRCKVRSWLYEVKNNPGISEMNIVTSLRRPSSMHSQGFSKKENACSTAMERSLKEVLPEARNVSEYYAHVYKEPVSSPNHIEGCKSDKVWLVVSSDEDDRRKYSSLKKWPKRYFEMFEDYGYYAEEIERSRLYTKASVCDLVLEAEFEHKAIGERKAYAWLHTVSANDGENEDSVVRSLVKLGFSPSLPLGIGKRGALYHAVKEVFKPMKSTGRE